MSSCRARHLALLLLLSHLPLLLSDSTTEDGYFLGREGLWWDDETERASSYAPTSTPWRAMHAGALGHDWGGARPAVAEMDATPPPGRRLKDESRTEETAEEKAERKRAKDAKRAQRAASACLEQANDAGQPGLNCTVERFMDEV